MAEVYSRNMMKVAVAKMLQTIGWNSINSTPLEILTDIMTQYLMQIARSTHDYANEFGCVEPSLDHLGLAFRDFHVNLQDLEEYVTYVNFAPTPTPVPKYPVAKEDNLNFLKPGSKEVITRPVHIHEHLPPMLQTPEVPEYESPTPIKTEEEDVVVNVESASPVFKRPADVSPGETFKRPRLTEEEGRPTREISSVMMTTSGYISPAREGKLPESRTPIPPVEPVAPRPVTPPQPVSSKVPPAAAPPVATGDTKEAINYPPASAFENPVPPPKTKAPNKKVEKPEKKKSSKELFKSGALEEGAVKKPEKVKRPLKEPKIRKKQQQDGTPGPPKKVPDKTKTQNATSKLNKTLAAARLKTEKLNTTITPISNKIDKLSSEPDKKKANIFKKISNVKNEKEVKPVKFEVKSRETSPDLVIDEPVDTKLNIPRDVTIELVNAAPNVEKQEQLYFDDSPPGTPSTPKTPEMIVHQTPPEVIKEKRKRKDKTKVKKLLKPSSPIEMELERPKTPEAHIPSITPHTHFPQFPSFPAFPGVPGLSCPPQLINPFIPMNPMNPNPFFGLNSPIPPFMPRPPGFPLIPPIPPKQDNIEIAKSKVPADSTSMDVSKSPTDLQKLDITKKKKDKKDKIKKKNKKDKLKNKGDKKKLKEEKKDKIKKEKKEKRKEKERESNNLKLTLKIGGEVSPRPDTPEKKLIIKPIVKREDVSASSSVEIKREMSPELAKISALVTGQPKPKLSPVVQANNISSESFHLHVKKTMFKPNPCKIRPKEPKQELAIDESHVTSTVKSKYIDSDGNEVWICPACGRQDDGSPMIGCDDCDAWYHWVCVGIQVPPDETENWYCRQCIAKKQEVLHTDKKKKRKKKEKKEH